MVGSGRTIELSMAVVIVWCAVKVGWRKIMSREELYMTFMRGLQSLYSKFNSHSCQDGLNNL